MTTETEKPVDLDFWGKVAAIAERDRGDYAVEIERTAPEFDDSNTFIKGYCAEIPLPEFSKTRMYQITGGGAFICIVRDIHKGTIRIRHTVSFAGEPRPVYLSGASREKTEVSRDTSKGPGSFDEGYRKALEDRNKDDQVKELNKTLQAIQQQIGTLQRSGNGNGNGHHNATLEAIETLVKAKELIGGGQGDGLGLKDALALMEKSETKGEQRAKDLADLAMKYSKDPDAATENSMVEVLLELVKGGRQDKNWQEATKGKPGLRGALEIFQKFKNDLADIVAEYNALAASAVRGAQTPDELLTAIREMLALAAKQQEEEDDEEEETEETEKENAREDRPGDRAEKKPEKPEKKSKKSDNKDNS